jgi:hypothetical protein
MRKIFLVIALILWPVFLSFAETTEDQIDPAQPDQLQENQNIETEETLVPSIKPTDEKLVNLDKNRETGRLYELERRLIDLERQVRFQDDRIRDLDREVEDIRRRALR